MSLKHTILGYLNQQELSGYDLQKKIEKTIQHFWSSTQSQIYRTLKELIDDEYVAMQVIYQDSKPNRKLYSITDKGKSELLQWLNHPIELPNHRNQFLVQLFFSDIIEDNIIVSNLEHYKSIMQSRLEFLNNYNTNMKNIKDNETLKHRIYSLIAENGIMALENEIEWVKHAIKKISK